MDEMNFDLSWSCEDFSLIAKATLDTPITALVGPSGGGKTSLVNLLAGLVRPTRGFLHIRGDTLVDTDKGTFVPPWQRRFGVVFQESRLWPHQSVLEQIRFGGHHREEEVITLCGLAPFLSRRPTSLSGGEKQRVALARALMSNPRALILDEPLVSLDTGARRQLLDVLAELRKSFEIPMLYVTHDLQEALELTDSFLVMDGGVLSGPSGLFEHAKRPGLFETINMLGLETILCAEVKEDDTGLGVCRSRAGQWRLTSPRNTAQVGTVIRLGVQPQDVLLARGPVGNISARNVMEGTITTVRKLSGHHIVEVDIGQPIIAEVTQEAIDALELREGEQVTVFIKSSAFKFRGTY